MIVNQIVNIDAREGLRQIDSESVDLVVTSPPYDNLRTYDDLCDWSFEVFKDIANGLYTAIKRGGVIVWVVSDATVNGSETGTSFRQALYFKEIGFNIHDTMIWKKDTMAFPETNRYPNWFEYMFVFSKGKPKTFNPIIDKPNKYAGSVIHGTSRNADGTTFRKSNEGNIVKETGWRENVWYQSGNKLGATIGHPAPFPAQLAKDHIITWSNEGDIILDPFMGSGSTALACIETNRRYIGFEINPKYCEIAENRIYEATAQIKIEI